MAIEFKFVFDTTVNTFFNHMMVSYVPGVLVHMDEFNGTFKIVKFLRYQFGLVAMLALVAFISRIRRSTSIWEIPRTTFRHNVLKS